MSTLSGIELVRRDGQLIIVTISEVRRGASAGVRHREPPQHEMVLGPQMSARIESAGGVPAVALLGEASLEPLRSCAGGVCLSGGPDLD